MNTYLLGTVASTFIVLFVLIVSPSTEPAIKLSRALASVRNAPVHLEDYEMEALTLHLEARRLGNLPPLDPDYHKNPVPSVIPESLRLQTALGQPPSVTAQQYAYLTEDSITDAVKRSVDEAFGRDLLEEGDMLTAENTEPLKIHINWNNFDAATAKPYTTCFNTGDWSFSGNMVPGLPPPDNSFDYPVCESDFDPFSGGNVACWRACTPTDVLNTERFNFLKANVEKSVANVEEIYRVPKMDGPLKFSSGDMSDFANGVLGWKQKGVCGPATFGYCDTFLPDEFCTTGVPGGANVVLNMVYRPEMWGGGYGGSCEFDQRGRPISIAFWNHVSLRDTITGLDALGYDSVAKNKYLVGLSTHEINHGLGFNIMQFRNADVVTKRDVYSLPDDQGTLEDSLYFFNPDTRVSKIAQVHFDCWDEDKWHGVPLMGAVEKGRDSHMNSFIMIEDVEAYGTFQRNTPFTLAALEDTGHYLANYTFSEFPNWGAYRGCDFVSTRCRTRGNADLVYDVFGDNEECDRDFKTNTNTKYEKCAAPGCGNKGSCHPECVVLTSDNRDEYLKLRPVMNGTGAFLGNPKASDLLDDLTDFMKSDLFQLLLPVIVWAVTALTLCCLRKLLCSSEKGAVNFSHFVSGIFLFFGLFVMGIAGYMYYFKELFIDAISLMGIYGVGGFGFLIALQAAMQWCTATGTNKLAFKLSAFISSFMLLIQFGLAIWIIMYNYSLQEVEGAAADGGSKWDDHIMGAAMKPMESYLCESYRNCCEDPVESENDDYVCIETHEGASNNLMTEQNDPSREEFCELVSGIKSVGVGAAKGMGEAACNVLEDIVQGFDRSSCQAEYCSSGVRGYEDFLVLVLSAFRRNFNAIGAVFFLLMIVQMEQMRILRELYELHKADKDEQEGKSERRRKSTIKGKGRSNTNATHRSSNASAPRRSSNAAGRKRGSTVHKVVSQQQWECLQCTLINETGTHKCAACGNPYGAVVGVFAEAEDNYL
jgi:hypothetical protein